MGADATSCCAETIVDLPRFVMLAAGEYGGELELLVETDTLRPAPIRAPRICLRQVVLELIQRHTCNYSIGLFAQRSS